MTWFVAYAERKPHGEPCSNGRKAFFCMTDGKSANPKQKRKSYMRKSYSWTALTPPQWVK